MVSNPCAYKESFTECQILFRYRIGYGGRFTLGITGLNQDNPIIVTLLINEDDKMPVKIDHIAFELTMYTAG